MITFLSFIFGASLGSFANVVADRLRVKPIFGGRSMCLNCSKKLSWHELIPIVSFLKQKGRCNKCNSKLSGLYLWSEIVAGFLVATLPVAILQYVDILSDPKNLYYAIFLFFVISFTIAFSIAIIIYDLRHMLVPFEIALILLLIGMISTIVRQYIYGFNVYDFFSGAIVAAPYTFLYLFSKGKWVGMGDVFIYAAFGFIFGLPIGSTMFFYSVWLGAVVSLMLVIMYKREYSLKSEIPFTPFIIIGGLLAFYTHSDILGLYSLLY